MTELMKCKHIGDDGIMCEDEAIWLIEATPTHPEVDDASDKNVICCAVHLNDKMPWNGAQVHRIGKPK